MNSQEILIYTSQLVLLLIGIFFSRKKYFSNISLFWTCLLYFSSISAAFISAYLGFKCYEYDSVKYLDDAKLLLNFIAFDKSYLGLFFLSGGNSIYPQYYFPMLISTNTWSNYTSFTIEKYFLFFSMISKPNLFNISLFFGTIAFGTKLILLKLAEKLAVSAQTKLLLVGFLCIGGLDLFYCSGLYKETLILFFLVFGLYFIYSKSNWKKNLFFIFGIIQIVFLRFELGFLLISCFLGYLIYKIYQSHYWKFKLSVIAGCFLIVLYVYLSPLINYLSIRKSRFEVKQGLTYIDTPNFEYGILSYLKEFSTSFLGYLYRPLGHFDSKFYIIDLINGCLVFFILYLIFNFKLRIKSLFFFCFVLFILSDLLIIHIVPNYFTQFRYRSPFIILLIFSLVINKKHIN